MTAPVPLYQPLNTLKPVAENIWIADGDITWMNMGILRAPFSTRMTIIRLQDGSLWCHSPIAPDEALFAAIDALGAVRHLVSPNYIHYAHIPAWQARYPQATTWASPGVRERAAKNRIEVQFDADLGDHAPPDWAGQIAQSEFRGSRIMREIDFFHRASRTLILTDLIENIETAKMRGFWKLVMKLAGNHDPDGKAPIDMRATFTDRGAARASLKQLLAWQPQRIILAHGRCYMDNAEAELRRAFRWLGDI